MFGISFLELAIVALVAFFIIQPKDVRKLAYWYKYIYKKVRELKSIAQESIDEINQFLDEKDQDHAIGTNHGLHKVYDTNPLNKHKSPPPSPTSSTGARGPRK